jgi:hypothetical protein
MTIRISRRPVVLLAGLAVLGALTVGGGQPLLSAEKALIPTEKTLIPAEKTLIPTEKTLIPTEKTLQPQP